MAGVKHRGNVGHAHGHAGMPGIGGLNCIHSKRTDRVRHGLMCDGHQRSRTKERGRADSESQRGRTLSRPVVSVNRRNARVAPLTLGARRSEEHTSELQSLMRISYAVFFLKKK